MHKGRIKTSDTAPDAGEHEGNIPSCCRNYLLASVGPEAELLRPERYLGHRSARRLGEHRDAVAVVRGLGGARDEDHGGNVGGELELVLLEAIERGLVLEKDDLAELLD